jgi:phenylalanyl-tRNA synthetase beta chain
LGVEQRVGVLQLNLSELSALLENKNFVSNYQPASIYPEVVRDLAFLVKKEVEHKEILVSLLKSATLLVKAELFDIYEGNNIGEGYKSMAYRLTYADPKRTLTTAEVDSSLEKAQKELKKEFGAEIR